MASSPPPAGGPSGITPNPSTHRWFNILALSSLPEGSIQTLSAAQVFGAVARDPLVEPTDELMDDLRKSKLVFVDPNSLQEPDDPKWLKAPRVAVINGRLERASNVFEVRLGDDSKRLDEAEIRGELKALGLELARTLPHADDLAVARLDDADLFSRRYQRPLPNFLPIPSVLRRAELRADRDSELETPWHFDIAKVSPWTTGGSGTAAAVVDFRFDLEHPALRNSAVHGATVDQSGVIDSGGAISTREDCHGTAVAGRCIGRVVNGQPGGPAPEADFIPLMLLPYEGADGPEFETFTEPQLAAAIEHATNPRNSLRPADVLVLPFGAGSDWQPGVVLMSSLDFAASSGRGGDGMAIFYSVSNDNVTLANDGLSHHGVVVSVGRHDQNRRRLPCGFGTSLDLLGPGSNILGPTGINRAPSWFKRSGTSFAAPLAAGVALRWLAKNPATNYIELKHSLLNPNWKSKPNADFFCLREVDPGRTSSMTMTSPSPISAQPRQIDTYEFCLVLQDDSEVGYAYAEKHPSVPDAVIEYWALKTDGKHNPRFTMIQDGVSMTVSGIGKKFENEPNRRQAFIDECKNRGWGEEKDTIADCSCVYSEAP